MSTENRVRNIILTNFVIIYTKVRRNRTGFFYMARKTEFGLLIPYSSISGRDFCTGLPLQCVQSELPGFVRDLRWCATPLARGRKRVRKSPACQKRSFTAARPWHP